MVTYQDFLAASDKTQFVKSCIEKHKTSDLYQTALLADEYDRHENRTIKRFQKLIRDVTGRDIPDIWGANYKMASRFFSRFIVQENQYLLGNGITWGDESTGDKLGKHFDTQIQKLGRMALSGGVSFGFWNLDHMEPFSVLEFVPLYDEENGALMAGVRWWQIDTDKPLRATLYETDGFTEYQWDKDHASGFVLYEKRAYKLNKSVSVIDGVLYKGENYPTFPIVPLWGNPQKQSEIIGLQEQIDCYDLIKSGYANNVEDGSIIYWALNGSGGMDEKDLSQFVEKMKSLHAAIMDDGVKAEPHQLEAPYESREALLKKLRADMYEDAMALDTQNIASGAVTATQIKAAYEPLNSKTDEYEYCVRQFLEGLLAIVGIQDEPTFTRSVLVNSQEEIQTISQVTQYLDDEYITRKVLTLLGDGDLAEDVLKRLTADELVRGGNQNEDEDLDAEEE